MTLDRDMSNQAKAYAQKIANMGQLMHSSQQERGDTVGENLAYACASNGSPLTGESATKMWYVTKHISCMYIILFIIFASFYIVNIYMVQNRPFQLIKQNVAPNRGQTVVT